MLNAYKWGLVYKKKKLIHFLFPPVSSNKGNKYCASQFKSIIKFC